MHNPDGTMEEDPGLLEVQRMNRRWYYAMTPQTWAAYNQHHREMYHRRKVACKCKCKWERERFHSLKGELKKLWNE